MRDHSMSFPEPENTVRYAIPNACNGCHTDKPAEWALDLIEKWYPQRSPRQRIRATTFAVAQKGDPRAVNALVRLANDRSENVAMRATAVGFLGRFTGPLPMQTLIAAAKDKEPMIRIEAARGLGVQANEGAAVALASLLDDPYLSVRVRAAGALTSPLFPSVSFSPDKQKSFDNAVAEFRRSLEVEGDHPNVQVRLGDLEATLGRSAEAREAYRRALKLDPAEPDAYVGLALLSLEAGNHEEAVRNARRAMEVSTDKTRYRKLLEKIESRQ
jgi:tetratricopeptide (TPR) repeat protein